MYKRQLLADAPLEELTAAADEIRSHFCQSGFDICTIVNGKCGKCSEDCKYCAQSARYPAEVESYPLLGAEPIAPFLCFFFYSLPPLRYLPKLRSRS